MDPTETLRQIREHAQAAREGTDVRGHERHIRWLVEDLDEWLSRGGFLPAPWERTPRPNV